MLMLILGKILLRCMVMLSFCLICAYQLLILRLIHVA
uniref:Uncharacterized protein n=1 Tax=Arundo donax TaxID=35708 RepID=A0A0A9ERY6_ARUDO